MLGRFPTQWVEKRNMVVAVVELATGRSSVVVPLAVFLLLGAPRARAASEPFSIVIYRNGQSPRIPERPLTDAGYY
jgi:hypothetical protein